MGVPYSIGLSLDFGSSLLVFLFLAFAVCECFGPGEMINTEDKY